MSTSFEKDVLVNREMFDHKNEERFTLRTPSGLSEEVVRMISAQKKEPEWMLDRRLKSLEVYNKMPFPDWGPDISKLKIEEISFYLNPGTQKAQTWENLPDDIKRTFERLGIPEAERTQLAGAGAQYESEAVYHNLKKEWEDKGVIFEDCDVAVQKYPDLVREYFMSKCVPPSDHKFAALHGAVWSGGTFLYVPEGVQVSLPLQAYFRMNAAKGGQFEHTLIIVEKDSLVHYIEGCSAPQYSASSLHAGCVEVFVKENARARYSSVENWSKNTFNLNTKRAIVEKNGVMEWVGGNMGSGVTMLYPCSVLKGENAKADHISIAYAGHNQNQDTGAKVFHIGRKTSSTIKAKSISKDGGISSYRGLVRINKSAIHSKSSVQCDALMLDEKSVSNTFPFMKINADHVDVVHEATVGRISQEQLFYLMSRGLSEEQAMQMIVSGFIEPVVKQLPLEYAVELNRLIQLEMERSLG
ncbi:MAG: Fe-S cluster assembly protein SufB [Candidatus Diapherotrites archaeon]|nr:Fe-S cluster assembly protein SufB [Candidatus Diapherotrites archaeon]